MKKQLILKQSVIAVALTLATSQFAVAQEAMSPDTQKVTVTGSNIKRTDKETSSPIQMITAKDIRDSGATTVAELMAKMPALGSGSAVDSTDGGFSRGAATASLRGLGSSSTLILLNGRRMTPSAYANPNSGQSTLYDLNNIPLSVIERVEILKDGASAVYGSDAVAGVINFITKNDYQGAEIKASASSNDDSQFRNERANLTAGKGNLDADGYNAFVSVDYYKRHRTALKDAHDIQAAQSLDMNALLNPYYSFATNQPFFYKEKTPNSGSFYTGTASSGGASSVVNRLGCSPANQLVGGAAYNILPSSALYGRTFCNYAAGNDLLEAQGAGEDVSLLSKGTFRINSTTTAFAEIAYTNSERKYTGVSRTIDGRSSTTAFPAVGAGNPFQAILPIGHPDNPFTDARAAVVYRFENVAGGSKNVSDSYRALAGLRGTAMDWDWEAALLWNRSERKETQYGYIFLPAVQQLITANKSLAQVAADPSISRPLDNKNYAQIVQFDAKATREFGRLAGGAIGVAVGFESRQEKIGMTPDAALQAGNVIGLVNIAVNGQRNVNSAYAEVRTPWFKTFETDAAVRVDKYPNLSTSTVPKIGAKWTPISTLAVRGTYAEGFVAPALSQTSPGGSQYFLNNLPDPVRCADGVNPAPGADTLDCKRSIAGIAGSSPDLKPQKSKSYTLGLIYSPTANVDVVLDWYRIEKKNEVDLLSYTTVLNNPSKYPGFVSRDQNQGTWLRDASGNLIPNSGPLLGVVTPFINQGMTRTSGIDFEFAMRNNLGENGKLETRLRTSYLLYYGQSVADGDVMINLAGTRGGVADWATSVGDLPRIKANLSTTWTKGPHVVNAALNFIDHISLIRQSDGPDVYPAGYCHYGSGQPSSAYSLGGNTKYLTYYPECKIPSWATLTVGYTFTGYKNWTLGLNIQNLFDTKAPYDPATGTTTGYDASSHNPYGRYFTVSANYKF